MCCAPAASHSNGDVDELMAQLGFGPDVASKQLAKKVIRDSWDYLQSPFYRYVPASQGIGPLHCTLTKPQFGP